MSRRTIMMLALGALIGFIVAGLANYVDSERSDHAEHMGCAMAAGRSMHSWANGVLESERVVREEAQPPEDK